jgi:hypothetical protein
MHRIDTDPHFAMGMLLFLMITFAAFVTASS